MNAESATLRAIKWTRYMMDKANYEPFLLAYMAANDIGPGDIEDVATEILEYLDRTAEEEKPTKEEQRTISIIGLEGKVSLEDLHKGIYLIMGKPECVRVQIITKDEPSPTAYQPVHFWEDQPTAAFWDSFVDVAAGEVIIADAWFE